MQRHCSDPFLLCVYGLVPFKRTCMFTHSQFLLTMTHLNVEQLVLSAPFDGDVLRLPSDSPRGFGFVTTPFLGCTGGKRLYVVTVPEYTACGHKKRGAYTAETLCFVFVEPSDFYPAAKFERDSWVPGRFYWLSGTGSLKYAPLSARTDTQNSLGLTTYSATGKKKALVAHSLLGWTFCCSSEWEPFRWNPAYEINHKNTNHGDNKLANLEPRRGAGPGGHRQESGALGPPAKRRRW